MKVGVLGEAMQRAGVKRPEMAQDRLRNMALDALKQPDSETAFIRAIEDDPEATLCLFTVDEIIAHARRYISALSREQEMRGGKGRLGSTDGRADTTPPASHSTKSSGAKAGQPAFTDGRETHTRHLPGHAKQRDPAALRDVAATVAQSVLDSFAIIDRNGERLPIGDIYISSYDRLIQMTAKRSWRASREHALLNLLKAETERRAAYLPPETKTRDVFDEAAMGKLIETATSLAMPKIEAAA